MEQMEMERLSRSRYGREQEQLARGRHDKRSKRRVRVAGSRLAGFAGWLADLADLAGDKAQTYSQSRMAFSAALVPHGLCPRCLSHRSQPLTAL